VGNPGSIEKVMVFGILVIILGILGIAVWGNGGNDRVGHASTMTPPGGDGLMPQKPTFGGDDVDNSSSKNDPDEFVDVIDGPDGPGAVPFEIESNVPVENGKVEDGAPPVADTDPPKEPVTPEPVARPDYTVKKGDTLEKIAKDHYGDRKYVVDIQKANGNLNPQKIFVGQVLKMPAIDTSQPVTPKNGAAIEKDPQAPVAAEPPKTVAKPKTHTIEPGDNLVKIVRRYYGDDMTKVQAIRNLNKDVIKDQNKLPVGKTIKLP
jgi:nucleoid-associated protein YgaU